MPCVWGIEAASKEGYGLSDCHLVTLLTGYTPVSFGLPFSEQLGLVHFHSVTEAADISTPQHSQLGA